MDGIITGNTLENHFNLDSPQTTQTQFMTLIRNVSYKTRPQLLTHPPHSNCKPVWVLDTFTNKHNHTRSTWRYAYIYDLTQTSFKVHYYGWDNKWDTTLYFNDPDTIKRICFNHIILKPFQYNYKICYDISKYNKGESNDFKNNILTPEQIRQNLSI